MSKNQQFIINVIKWISIFTFLMSTFSCKHKKFDKFKISTFTVNSSANIQKTIPYKNKYYCLTSDNKVICLNLDFKIDTINNLKLNKQNIDDIFLSGDSLIGILYFKGKYTPDYYLKNKLFYLNEKFGWIKLSKNKIENAFYEDDKYLVTACCNGEFGGSIKFTDKKNLKMYSCPATCATNINKIDNIYYVTNSLIHGYGSTEVLKIKDPIKLYNLTNDTLNKYCSWWWVLHKKKEYNLTKYYQGVVKLIDTTEVITLSTFMNNNKLFFINSDRQNTYLCKLENNKFITVKRILNKSLQSYNPINTNNDGKQIHNFEDNEKSGFIVIEKNNISILFTKNIKHL